MKPVSDRKVESAQNFMARFAYNVHEAENKIIVGETTEAVLYLMPDKESWRKMRTQFIGASDAPTIESLTDSWRTRKDLFDEKTGAKPHEDLSGNELVDMGNAEEPLVRELFALEHPQFDVYDGSNLLWVSKRKPWASCTLDAIAFDNERGTFTDVEIKCAPYSGKWRDDFMPDNYFVQILFQLFVTGFYEAHLRARLRYGDSRFNRAVERSYSLTADIPEVTTQTDALISDCEKFYNQIKSGEYFPSLRI